MYVQPVWHLKDWKYYAKLLIENTRTKLYVKY